MLKPNIKLTAPFGAAKKKDNQTGGDLIDDLVIQFHNLIESSARDHIAATRILHQIHSQKLYLKYAPTFVDFCDEKLGLSKSTVYRRLQQYSIEEVTGEITQNVPPWDKRPLIENDFRQEQPANAQIVEPLPAVFPASKLPQPAPKPRDPDAQEQRLRRAWKTITKNAASPGWLDRLEDWLGKNEPV